jgi:hypothetical protein
MLRFGCLVAVLICAGNVVGSAQTAGAAACKVGVVEGDLEAGKDFRRPIGSGLSVWFQATRSGWILRVVPTVGQVGEHDYAELATPPYRSVTPLAITTDFSFRSQDAVGWNPRRFHFATSAVEFARFRATYQRYQASGWKSGSAEAELTEEIGRAAEGKLTIVDAKLEPGMADQSRMAAAVSSRFEQTAHTLVAASNGKSSDLGKLVWVRIRLELALPVGFREEKGLIAVGKQCAGL